MVYEDEGDLAMVDEETQKVNIPVSFVLPNQISRQAYLKMD